MASKSGKKKTTTRKQTGQSSRKGSQQKRAYTAQENAIFHEVELIILFAVVVFLFLCNFGIIGTVGNSISGVMFGLFGFTAYVFPVAIFVAAAFWFANQGSPTAVIKLVAGVALFVMCGVVFEFINGTTTALEAYDIKKIYEYCSVEKGGGGILAGSVAYLLYHFLDMVGAILVVIVLSIISIVILTERSFVNGVKKSGKRVMEMSKEDSQRRREYAQMRRQKQDELREQREEERRLKEDERRLREEELENEKILRMDKKVSGVTIDTSLSKGEEHKTRDDIHEITLNDEAEIKEDIPVNHAYQMSYKQPDEIHEVSWNEPETAYEQSEPVVAEEIPVQRPPVRRERPVARAPKEPERGNGIEKQMTADIQAAEKKVSKTYIFPPLSRLQKGVGKTGDSSRELKETAMRLQQTLNTFGVKVSITDISQGPAVTRYELQPEVGVKVSKIVGLADDIKLNLAATDIRIEAPIPGKAAIGIEVPNKENTPVALRDLLETREFKEFSSNLAFAVGKDIAGKTVVSDIAKMPHMLIAGATGSGKSVCINTLIMSLLYKAHPDDVKLIMIDPKVVELSVYNGIPHLLVPVVTDPKKAAAALNWGVAEMTDRYKKFADFNVRDLKGYNQKVESMQEQGADDTLKKMPQIVIIVDELADLMMVAPGEVEESICRLAQLARAAGIHLIIATQRPSVDVITGLIKANMPSRVAFSVSSGVDSRTILDMNGAEKLLGKGDMLFYPQGYTKPVRVQGAFVSDREVADVVDFLKNQAIGNTYAEDIEEKIQSLGASSSAAGGSGSDSADSRDEYFADAGRFIIEKDKASIGMLQRMFKIGFNRAARIMDQLCDYGVVGEEEGTKPRKVLMSMEQFEQLLEEI
ncbi:MAG: DNA translocase FtsK [Lachnospiraceae bacterium]|nr:DNA translocase FtsK [Lachnospiraceae bacterium]